jgi:tRNA(Ile2)-agmatinylcytidine synthase
MPHTIQGGHVLFRIRDSSGVSVDCAAYEPTKEFRGVIRKLLPGDRVRVWGGVRDDPITINLEGIEVRQLVSFIRDRPSCCGRRMESMGKGQGFRCRVCRRKSKHMVKMEINREITTGRYHVPPCATRHISMPEKRMIPTETQGGKCMHDEHESPL